MGADNFCLSCGHKFDPFAFKCENCNHVFQDEIGVAIKQECEASEDHISQNHISMTCDEMKPEIMEAIPGEHLEIKQAKIAKKRRANEFNSSRQGEKRSQQTTKHFEVIRGPPYACNKCNTRFKRLSALKAHQSLVHEVVNEIEEPICEIIKKEKLLKHPKLSKSQQTLKLSEDNDSDVYSEGVSSNEEIDIEPMQVDLNSLYDSLTKIKQNPIGENIYKCRMCKKMTLRLQEHLKHIVSHTGCKNYDCVLCEEIFLDKTSLDEHIVQKHTDTDAECLPCGMFHCKTCSNYFLSPAEWERHNRWHADKQKFIDCNICQIGFTCQKSFEKHNKVIHENTSNLPKKFKCFLCNERFPHLILLTNHKRSHPEFFKLIERTTLLKHFPAGKKIQYTCRICGKSTYSHTHHFEHLQIHNSDRPKFQCKLCSKQFTAQSTLNVHVRLHSGERPYRCEICQESYRHRKSLRKHLQKHTGIRPVKCQHCDNTFIDQNQCTEHVRRVHTGETPYQCDICGEWFTVFSQLPLHKIQRHNVDTRKKRTVDIIPKIDEQN